MPKTDAHKNTKQLPLDLQGSGNHLIASFLLIIGQPKLVHLQKGVQPIQLNRRTMASILRRWRVTGGRQLDRPSAHAAAIFDLAPAFLGVPPPEAEA